MLWRFGALALGGSLTLWRFLALVPRLKASKLQRRVDALALWRLGAWRLFDALALLGACPTSQSLKAAKPRWRFTPQSLKAAKPLSPFSPQSLKGSKLQRRLDALALWRFGA